MTKKYNWCGFFLICTLIAPSTGAEAEPIHEAAVDGDAARVKQLLIDGADVNAPDAAGTPLQWALFASQTDIVRLLLEHGADPNIDSPAGTPLHAVAISGNTEIVKLLLDHGGDPNRGDSSTPLNAAAQRGNLEIVDLLLERGADSNFSTFDGMTALHAAARAGHLETAMRLVDHGADVNALTAVGKPPIHFAVAGKHTALADYLKEQGAAPGEIAPITDLLGSAVLAEGELEAKVCTECHPVKMGTNSTGPSLWNVVGRPRGSVGDFAYSQTFATLEGVWTFDALNEFLARPREIIPGTKMEFPGMADPQIRANVIAYLRTLSDNPVPLP